MISNLLSGLDGAAPSGLHALLNTKAAGSHSSFARLLQQQSDLVDTDLEQWLLSLNIEPDALFAELHAAGLNPKALLVELKNTPELNKELTQALKDSGVPSRFIQALEEAQNPPPLASELEATTQPDDDLSNTALSFIQSTLFIAQEASSLRRDASVRQPIENSLSSSSRFQTPSAPLSDNLVAASRFVAIGTENPTQTAMGAVSTGLITPYPTTAATPLSAKTTQHPTVQSNTDLRFDPNPNLGSSNKSPNAVTFNLQAPFNQPESQEALRQSFNAFQATPTLGPTDTTATIAFAPPQLVNSPLQSMLALPPNYSAQLPTPVTHTHWGSDLGRVVVNLGQQAQLSGPQNAEIRLDPPELGPLRIMLSVTDNVAHATIYAAHAQTRLVVEQALPQLQQQLAQSGLSLGEANVSDQGFSSHTEQNSSQQQASTTFNLEGNVQSVDHSALPELDEGTKRLVPDAIIDTFA